MEVYFFCIRYRNIYLYKIMFMSGLGLLDMSEHNKTCVWVNEMCCLSASRCHCKLPSDPDIAIYRYPGMSIHWPFLLPYQLHFLLLCTNATTTVLLSIGQVIHHFSLLLCPSTCAHYHLTRSFRCCAWDFIRHP